MKKVVLCAVGVFAAVLSVAVAIETYFYMKDIATWTDLREEPSVE